MSASNFRPPEEHLCKQIFAAEHISVISNLSQLRHQIGVITQFQLFHIHLDLTPNYGNRSSKCLFAENKLLNTFHATVTCSQISQVSSQIAFRQFNLKSSSSADSKLTPTTAANQLRMLSVKLQKDADFVMHKNNEYPPFYLFIHSFVSEMTACCWLDQCCQKAACLIRSLLHCS